MSKIKIVSDWKDDLCWCPSQCYLKLTHNNQNYVVYLRWRHSDPWTATLIECDDSFDITAKTSHWIELNIQDWTDDQLDEVKEEAFNMAKVIIYKNA